MSEYQRLKKIIPPDQALANQALAKSMLQIKGINDISLLDLADTVINLESNKGLGDINALTTPLPDAIANFWANTFPTGTGAGNAITTNDMIGIAAGATVNDQLPIMTETINALDSVGALTALTGNGGASGSVNNGIYTIMEYCLAGSYGAGPIVLPTTTYFTPAANPYASFDSAFANALIPAANAAISNIAASQVTLTNQSNSATNAIADQLLLNQNNLVIASVNIGNIVIGDWANSDISANQQSSALSLATRLHDIGLDISEGGSAQFFEQIANVQNVAGQAVIGSMREGRNRSILESVGITADTQLSDVNLATPVANNLINAQYTTSQATGNIVI